MTTTPRSYFVDPAKGSNANAGTAAKPFKTLGKALSAAGSGDTVRLAKGGYTSTGAGTLSGDVYPLHVRSGVTIRGTPAAPGVQGTFLSPAHSADHTPGLVLDGSATIQDLEMAVFGTAVSASAGTQTLRNVNLILNQTGVLLRGSARATLTRAYLFLADNVGARAFDRAHLTIDGGELASGGCGRTSLGVSAVDSTVLEVRNAKLAALVGGTVTLAGKASGTMTDVEVATPKAPCPFASTVLVRDAARLTATDVRASGVPGTSRAFAEVVGAAALQADGVAVSGYAFGVSAGTVSAVSVANSSFQSNSVGLSGGLDTRLTVTGSTFSDNSTALNVSRLVLRRSTVTGGGTAIEAHTPLVDLGRPDDPGFNIFRGATGTEVLFNPSQGGVDLLAVGNTWNFAQGATAAGTYSTSLVASRSAAAFGQNFSLHEPSGAAAAAIRIRLNP